MIDFTSLGLSPEILRAVMDSGYTTPTPIQEQAIPVALAGRDVLGIAQTGTGKTAAFTLPMIERLAAGRARARMPRSLVIEPTRELADQVAASFDKYAKGQKLSWALLIGGVSFDEQEKKLDRGVDVLIATPGRLLDHFERGKLLLTGVQIMVVDEADRMLDMGFIPDIERIFKLTPPNRQTLFFSATMPPEITRLTSQFLKDPTRIEVDRPATTADTITQRVAKIPTADPKAKRAALRALIAGAEVKNAIIFCNRKSEVDVVAKSLAKHGIDAAPIHGDLDQSTRTRTLENFRRGDLRILVASDVAARGLDVPAVSHIFNYDVPHHAEDYVHRIGRTGRAGRLGEAFMIVTPADERNYEKVIKLTKKQPELVTLDLDWSDIEADDLGRRGDRGPTEKRERSRSARHQKSEPQDLTAKADVEDASTPEPPGPKPTSERTGRANRSRSRTRRPRQNIDVSPHADAASFAGEDRDPVEPASETSASERGGYRAPDLSPPVIDSPDLDTDPSPQSSRWSRGRQASTERPSSGRPSSRRESPGREGIGAYGEERRHRQERAAGSDTSRASPGRETEVSAVVGFGADVPAFLLRAAPAPPAASDANPDEG